MARRKRGYSDDGDSSDSVSSSGSIEDRVRLKKGKGKEDAIYGIFGDEGENEQRGGIGRTVRGEDRKGRKIDYLRGQAFVSAKNDIASSSNFEKDKEDESMESKISDSEESGESENESSSSEMEKYAHLAAEEREEEDETELHTAFRTVPTMADEKMKEYEIYSDGFKPSSFVSSRAGIGSSKKGIGALKTEQLHSGEETEETVYQHLSSAGIGSRAGIGSNGNTGSEADGKATSRMTSFHQFMPANSPAVSSTLNQSSLSSHFQQNRPHSSAFSQRASKAKEDDIVLGSMPKISFKTGGGKFDPAKYLAQMGWSGGGLGKGGEGIVKPIEVKQRPERAGIAFGGIKEKTRQAKEEARRRGEEVSSDEEDRKNRLKKDKKEARAQTIPSIPEEHAWTKPERKPRKPKIEHRTYEQILAEHGHLGMSSGQNLQQIVIDASGKEYSSVSAALAKHAVPTNDSTQLIEIRHNLRLICDGNIKALDLLANEGSAIRDRRKWLERDLSEISRRKQDLASKLALVETVVKIVTEIEMLGKRAAEDTTIGLDSFFDPVQRILRQQKDVIAEMELDSAIVGAIVPVFKRELSQWSLLQDPARLCHQLKRISGALCISSKKDPMTPYQSLLWNVWMPAVRSALNNEWIVTNSTSVTKFYDLWKPLLPAFILDNVSQQLILPKLRSAVSDWDGKSALYKIVFPWMPLLQHQMDDVVAESKRRIRSSLKSWKVSSGIPSELRKWKDVFRRSEWDSMLLTSVVEKLSTYLRVELKISSDPLAQDRQPLKDVLQWKAIMDKKMLSKVLLNGFIPNWLEHMHAMLIRPNSNTVEVADWYSKWKAYLKKKEIDQLEGVQIGFQAALQMMDHSLRFERGSLQIPNLKQMQRRNEAGNIAKVSKVKSSGEQINTSSFRQIVEEAAAEADLIVQSLNKTDERSGMPLYRISRSIDGKSGQTFYLEDDVIFLERKSTSSSQHRGQFDPVSIEELTKSCT